MQVTAKLDFGDDDVAKLASLLGCAPEALEAQLAGHAAAALSEYLQMYLGQRAFSRGSDILEHRLVLLIQQAFTDRIPTANEVARLFQLTPSQARTLIRSTVAKYRYQLDGAARASAKRVLESVKWLVDNNAYRAEIESPNLVEILNQRLSMVAGAQQEVYRTKGTITSYDIAPGSYDPLCVAFSAKPVPR